MELKGGLFLDNWGLSLMRSRQVLLYLINPKKGALPATRWSAAGFADTDPIATNKTEEGKQKNRPQTWARLTKKGKKEFDAYLEELQRVIQDAHIRIDTKSEPGDEPGMAPARG